MNDDADDSASRLRKVLACLRRSIPGLHGSVIADKSGLPMASDLPQGIDVMTVSAMSALAMQSCGSIMSNLGLQPAEIMVIEAKDTLIFVKALANWTASLFVVMSADVERETVRRDIDQAARTMDGVLGS